MSMRLRLLMVALCAAVLAAEPAHAQLGSSLGGGATVVEGLVIKGFGGPPWWKVTNGISTVYVLATPGSVPADLKFSQKLIDRRIATANVVITPPVISYAASGDRALPVATQLFKALNQSRSTELEASLPADLRKRFGVARGAIRQPENRYGALPAGLAGMAVAGDTAIIRGSASDQKLQSVQALVELSAKRQRVRIEPAKTMGSSTMTDILGDLLKPGAACLSAVLDRMEASSARGASDEQRRAVAEAWAEGDVKPLLDALRNDDNPMDSTFSLWRQDPVSRNDEVVNVRVFGQACLAEMPTIQSLSKQFLTDEADAIERALKKPGHAVAVVEAGGLLVTGGVLDQLRQRGYTITTPDVD